MKNERKKGFWATSWLGIVITGVAFMVWALMESPFELWIPAAIGGFMAGFLVGLAYNAIVYWSKKK